MTSNRWTDKHSDKMILIYPLNTNKDMKSDRWTDRHMVIPIYPPTTNQRDFFIHLLLKCGSEHLNNESQFLQAEILIYINRNGFTL